MPAKATQAPSDQARSWAWIDRAIWTEPMLAALDNGAKGNKWPQAKCVLRGTRVVHRDSSPCISELTPMRKPLTGEPCAGEPHARFGGRGGC